MDIILVNVNLVFSTVEVEDSRLDKAVETEDVDSKVETTVIVVGVNSVFSSVEVEDLILDEAVDTGDVDVASKVETTVTEVGLGDENSEKSISDDLPTVGDWLMEITLVDVNLVFWSVKVEDLRLDEAVDSEYVDVDSEVETTVIVVGLGVDNSEISICDIFFCTLGDWEVSVKEVVNVFVDLLRGKK